MGPLIRSAGHYALMRTSVLDPKAVNKEVVFGLVLQANLDHVISGQDGAVGGKGDRTRDPDKSSRVVADRTASIQQSGSQVSQTSEEDALRVNGLLASNKAHGQPAMDNNRPVTGQRGIGSTAADNNALLDGSALGQRHDEQSSKLAIEQTPVSASLQSNGDLNNVTVRNIPEPAVALRPAVKPQPADREDLLIVMPSSIDRMPIVKASRGWRQGVRTYIAFEEEVDLDTAPSVFRVCFNAFQAACNTQLSAISHSCHV